MKIKDFFGEKRRKKILAGTLAGALLCGGAAGAVALTRSGDDLNAADTYKLLENGLDYETGSNWFYLSSAKDTFSSGDKRYSFSGFGNTTVTYIDYSTADISGDNETDVYYGADSSEATRKLYLSYAIPKSDGTITATYTAYNGGMYLDSNGTQQYADVSVKIWGAGVALNVPYADSKTSAYNEVKLSQTLTGEVTSASNELEVMRCLYRRMLESNGYDATAVNESVPVFFAECSVKDLDNNDSNGAQVFGADGKIHTIKKIPENSNAYSIDGSTSVTESQKQLSAANDLEAAGFYMEEQGKTAFIYNYLYQNSSSLKSELGVTCSLTNGVRQGSQISFEGTDGKGLNENDLEQLIDFWYGAAGCRVGSSKYVRIGAGTRYYSTRIQNEWAGVAENLFIYMDVNLLKAGTDTDVTPSTMYTRFRDIDGGAQGNNIEGYASSGLTSVYLGTQTLTETTDTTPGSGKEKTETISQVTDVEINGELSSSYTIVNISSGEYYRDEESGKVNRHINVNADAQRIIYSDGEVAVGATKYNVNSANKTISFSGYFGIWNGKSFDNVTETKKTCYFKAGTNGAVNIIATDGSYLVFPKDDTTYTVTTSDSNISSVSAKNISGELVKCGGIGVINKNGDSIAASLSNGNVGGDFKAYALGFSIDTKNSICLAVNGTADGGKTYKLLKDGGIATTGLAWYVGLKTKDDNQIYADNTLGMQWGEQESYKIAYSCGTAYGSATTSYTERIRYHAYINGKEQTFSSDSIGTNSNTTNQNRTLSLGTTVNGEITLKGTTTYLYSDPVTKETVKTGEETHSVITVNGTKYVFSGWYTDSSLTNRWEGGDVSGKVSGNKLTGTLDLYGKWEPLQGTVSLLKTETSSTASAQAYYIADSEMTAAKAPYNGKAVAGAVYGIYPDESCTTQITTLTTGENAVSRTLTPGTYYIKEISAPRGYRLNTTVCSFTIELDKTTYIYTCDLKQTVNLSERVLDWDYHSQNGNAWDSTGVKAVEGVEFYLEIVNSEGKIQGYVAATKNDDGTYSYSQVMQTNQSTKTVLTSDSSGYIKVNGLPLTTEGNSYVFVEKATVDGYVFYGTNNGDASWKKADGTLTLKDNSFWDVRTVDQTAAAYVADKAENTTGMTQAAWTAAEKHNTGNTLATQGLVNTSAPSITVDYIHWERRQRVNLKVTVEDKNNSTFTEGGTKGTDGYVTIKGSQYDLYCTSDLDMLDGTTVKAGTLLATATAGLNTDTGKVAVTFMETSGGKLLPNGKYRVKLHQSSDGYVNNGVETGTGDLDCTWNENRCRYSLSASSNYFTLTPASAVKQTTATLKLTRQLVDITTLVEDQDSSVRLENAIYAVYTTCDTVAVDGTVISISDGNAGGSVPLLNEDGTETQGRLIGYYMTDSTGYFFVNKYGSSSFRNPNSNVSEAWRQIPGIVVTASQSFNNEETSSSGGAPGGTFALLKAVNVMKLENAKNGQESITSSLVNGDYRIVAVCPRDYYYIEAGQNPRQEYKDITIGWTKGSSGEAQLSISIDMKLTEVPDNAVRVAVAPESAEYVKGGSLMDILSYLIPSKEWVVNHDGYPVYRTSDTNASVKDENGNSKYRDTTPVVFSFTAYTDNDVHVNGTVTHNYTLWMLVDESEKKEGDRHVHLNDGADIYLRPIDMDMVTVSTEKTENNGCHSVENKNGSVTYTDDGTIADGKVITFAIDTDGNTEFTDWLSSGDGSRQIVVRDDSYLTYSGYNRGVMGEQPRDFQFDTAYAYGKITTRQLIDLD